MFVAKFNSKAYKLILIFTPQNVKLSAFTDAICQNTNLHHMYEVHTIFQL